METENRFKLIFSELKADGWNQVKFGEAIGKTQQTVSRYLTGEIEPNEAIAIIIEAKFGYRKEWILKGELPKKIDHKKELAEVSRIAKQGRDLDLVPELRDLLDSIMKLPKDEYDSLILTIKRFVKKK